MFRNHNHRIGEYAQSGPEGLLDVLQFVIATVQQSIETVPGILDDFRKQGEASRFAFAWKGEALAYYRDNINTVYADAMRINASASDDKARARDLTAYFATLPGLGLIKGGFVAQMAFGVSGCLDRHNLKIYGVSKSRFAANAFKALRKAESRAARVAEYCDIIDALGGTEKLWDEWCQYVADLRPETFISAGQVSAIHVDALNIPKSFEIPF